MAITRRSTGEADFYELDDGSRYSSLAEAERAQTQSEAELAQTEVDDSQGTEQQTTTQEQTTAQTPVVNAADIVEVRGMSLAEAEAELRSKKGGATPGMLARIKRAEESGDAKFIAIYKRQFNSLVESYAKNNSVAVNTQTGEILDSVSNRWANRSAIGGAENYLKSKVVPKLAIDMEIDRILADSNTTGAEFSRVERYRGGYRAIGSDGSTGPQRDSEEEAVQSATDHFKWGQKVAETAEQKAQLIQLATKLTQFSDVSAFNANARTNILQAALPGVDRTEAWRFGNGIQKPVKYDPKTQQTYTTYGSGLTIELSETQDGPQANYNIVSPEGVRLTNFDFSTRQMLQYGISKEAVLAAGAKAEAAGLNPVANNKYTPLVYSLQNEVDPALFKNYTIFKNQEGILRDAALDSFNAGEGDLAARFEEARKSFRVDPSDTTSPANQFNNFKGKFFKDNYTGPTGTTLEEFVNSGGTMLEGLPEGMVDLGGGLFANPVDLSKIDADRRSSFDDKGVMKNRYGDANRSTLQYSLYGVASSVEPPAWSPDSYAQELNNIYKTPNNNIQFGSNGLEYRFADGSSKAWGGNIGNLNALPAMFGVEPVGGRQGELFKTAQQFDNAEEWEKWNATYKTRFDRPGEGAVQAPEVSAPTAAATVTPTDDLESTSQFQGTQPVEQTSYYQQQTPAAQQPVTPAAQTVQGPTGIQTPTGITGTGVYPQTGATTGTGSLPLQTAGYSAIPTTVPGQVQGMSGYTTQQLTQTMPGTNTPTTGVTTSQYKNQSGQTIFVTENNGQPITYVPPGYTKVSGAAQGGLMRSGYADGGVASSSEDAMLEAKYRIATMNGYQGPKTNASLNAFANASEGMKRKFNSIGTIMANKGGYIRKGFEEGGDVTNDTQVFTPGPFQTETAEQYQSLIGQTMQPMQAPVAQILPQEQDFMPTTAGQVAGVAPMAEAATVGSVQQAQMPLMAATATMQPTMATPQVQQETAQLQAAQGTIAPEAQIQAAQQQGSSVTGLQAAQGQAYLMNNPVQREIQQGELISGVADAERAAQFNEQIQAATATPTAQATVQGQLEGLMQQFEGGETPAWAAGSMRAAMATLSARGLGASSMAGQAVIQATMEAALPIAQMDAQVQAQFESQNLSNRQQRAMLAAQQRATFLGMEFDQEFQARVANSARIGDIANMNFTAEQNIALENSRAVNTMNLNNLSNRQAMVMAEAASLAQLDMANLNNRQQAAVQNAQNFLQMDMTNLSNEQQTTMFKAQQNIQALFTDQAATNAAAQFNAANENQTNQFFANLTSQTSQFNAAQQNAMDQFNVNSVNALREFNSNIQQQRDMFNAQNGLVVAQANAQWRQNIATLNTAAQNESNMTMAKTMNALTATNLDAYWQRERDIMTFAFSSAENAADRIAQVALQEMSADAKANYADQAGKGALTATLLKGGLNYMFGGSFF